MFGCLPLLCLSITPPCGRLCQGDHDRTYPNTQIAKWPRDIPSGAQARRRAFTGTPWSRLLRFDARVPRDLRSPRSLVSEKGGELVRGSARLQFDALLCELVANLRHLHEFDDFSVESQH